MIAASSGRGRGFTLIEVLVALAIVAVGMAAVLGTLTSSANTVAYLRDKTFANWVALNQITQVRLSGQVPSTGKSDGDTDFADRKWKWHQEVTATQVPGMVRIEMSVRPADVDVADSDRGWYSTLSGIYGDSLGAARGDLPSWGAQTLMPPNPAAPPAGSPPAGPTRAQPLQPVTPTPVQPSPQPVTGPSPPAGTP